MRTSEACLRRIVPLVALFGALVSLISRVSNAQTTPLTKHRYDVGTFFIIQVQLDKAKDKLSRVTDADIAGAANVLQARFAASPYSGAVVERAGEDLIYLWLPVTEDKELAEVRTKIKQTANLQFRLVDPENDEHLTWKEPDGKASQGYVRLPVKPKDDSNGAESKQGRKQMLVEDHCDLDGTYIERASASLGPNNGWVINIEFNQQGAAKFDELAAGACSTVWQSFWMTSFSVRRRSKQLTSEDVRRSLVISPGRAQRT